MAVPPRVFSSKMKIRAAGGWWMFVELRDDTAMITRRTLLDSALGLTALGVAAPLFAASPKRKFKLKFAPHLGQFTAHAGKGVVDQLKFMADQGFTALEDNSMMQRPIAEQETIARTLT